MMHPMLKVVMAIAVFVSAFNVLTWMDTNGNFTNDITMRAASRQLLVQEEEPQVITVCGRSSTIQANQDSVLNVHQDEVNADEEEHNTCPEFDYNKETLVLQGRSYGQTGNQLRSFVRAFQYVRDMKAKLGHDMQLAVMESSWAMDIVTSMWMISEDRRWKEKMEKELCIKILPRTFGGGISRLGLRLHIRTAEQLFRYRSTTTRKEQVSYQLEILRTLFRNYNTGHGVNQYRRPARPVQDMCSGIDAIFGAEERQFANYTTVHHRYLDGNHRTLEKVANFTGCDPKAALDMTPSYIKSILEPLGMLKNPVVVITDGQNEAGLQRLLDDPELGPMIRLVPEEACWVGGDLTLGVLANAFIGNPGSTLSAFIARSRIALGYGHNYLYRAKDNFGKWTTVCTDNCITF